MQYNKTVSVFPCEHRIGKNKTEKRCVVCRMPIKGERHLIFLYNTTAFFCCNTCKESYSELIEKMK